MTFFRKSSLFVAGVALAALLVPAIASAGPDGDRRPSKARKGDRERPSFPMTGAAFTAHVNKRLAKHEAMLDKRLTKATPEERAAAKAKFATHAAAVRAAAAKATADGTVTQDEAKEVRKAGWKHGDKRKNKKNKGNRKPRA